jgi:type IV secretory pathway VirJ component
MNRDWRHRRLRILVFAWLVASQTLAVADRLDDLPLAVDPPAHAGDDRLALVLSGDGGWQELPKSVAAALAAEGIGAVGLNSLKYFWRPHTPEQTAADLARVVEHYAPLWHTQRLVLVGFSFGADVLPSVVNHFTPELRERVSSLTLIAPSSTANFEIKVAGWLGGATAGQPTVPDIERLRGLPIVCLYGADDRDAVCPDLPAGLATVRKFPGGHHFGGDYAAVARAVLPEYMDQKMK